MAEGKGEVVQAFIRTRNLFLAFILSLTTNVRMGMIDPHLPLFIRDLGATVLEAGFLLSLSSFASVLVPVLGGLISDKYGKRSAILVSVLLSIFSPIFYTFAVSWKQLIPWILLNAAGASLFWPARTAIIADSVTRRKRGTAYGIMNLALPIGNLLGPAIGGFLVDHYGWNKMFYMVVLISTFSLLPTFLLTEPGSHVRKRKDPLFSSFKIDSKLVYPITVFNFLPSSFI